MDVVESYSTPAAVTSSLFFDSVFDFTGTRSDGIAAAKLTFARIDGRAFVSAHLRRPRVGDVLAIRLRRGVLADELTGATFCAPHVDRCGL